MTNQIPDPNDPVGGQTPNQPPTGPAQPDPQPQYQQPAPGQAQYQQPAASKPEQAANTITLNYWLSVFFTWLPALIFFLIEKGKNPLADKFHRENLNFSLVRTALWVAIIVVGWIPYLGWLIAIVGWLAQLVLFIFHIMAAAKAPENFKKGEAPGFIFNIPFIK